MALVRQITETQQPVPNCFSKRFFLCLLPARQRTAIAHTRNRYRQHEPRTAASTTTTPMAALPSITTYTVALLVALVLTAAPVAGLRKRTVTFFQDPPLTEFEGKNRFLFTPTGV